jgi:methionine-rich copper-binding protein CopC
MRGILTLGLIVAALASPAALKAADKLDARAMLVASTPAKDSVLDAVPQQIEMRFAEPAQVLSVTLRLPDDSEVSAEPDDDTKPGKARQFRFRLPETPSQPGNYSISYLLVSKSFKSLNGFIHFRIPGPPEPENPAQSEQSTEEETQ